MERQTMEEKKEIVLKYLEQFGWSSPTEIGMNALGLEYDRASSRACRVLSVLLKEKRVEKSTGRAKYRIRKGRRS